ncbi:sugar kinase [Microbacterium sp. LWS13-1.2]|uniref:Sugar kinase n=1 Tax=Microbacterium sp. LWS13-1.2 TaxID=3135264 RepID=A0AAU6SEG8_9MICO
MAMFAARDDGPPSRGDEYKLSMGGAESNVAIGLARLGVRSSWVGRVGDDALGRLIERELRAEKVTAHVTIDDASTGLMLKHRRTAHTQQVDYHRTDSAGSHIRPADLEGRLTGASVVHMTGITPALSASGADAVRLAVRSPAQFVSYDLNHRTSLWSATAARAFHQEILADVDVVFAGLDEARLVLDKDCSAEDAGRGLQELGPRIAVVKLGSRGALASTGEGIIERAAKSIVAVDTVGAGDAFVAGWLAGHVEGRDLAGCLDLGNAAGAFACMSYGDWEGYGTREELRMLDHDDPVTR